MLTIQAPIESFTLKTRDNTDLRVHKAGNGPHKWLLPPGLGTPLLSWKYLIEYFQDKMTIVTWDMRGCFDSGKPSDLNKLGVPENADDAMDILEHLGWLDEKIMIGGWSIAIQTSLELYTRIPDNYAGMILINGAFEHVLKTAMGIPNADKVFVPLLNLMSKASPIFAPTASYLLSQDWAIDVLRSTGIVAGNEYFFGEVVKEFKKLDFGTYFKTMTCCNEHSARDILPLVKVPTLITAGTGDKMTPPSVSEYVHDQIRHSELFYIPTGTHYTTIEFPEIVNLKLEQFFSKKIFKDSWHNC